MDNLINLNEISDENKEKILQILKEEQNKPSLTEEQELNAFFAKTRANRVKITDSQLPEDLKGIEIDDDDYKNQAFDERLNHHLSADGYKMKQKRLNGNLGDDDRETYRQLYMIHENGVANFWSKVKEVVDRKVDIRKEDVSDELPSDVLDTMWIKRKK